MPRSGIPPASDIPLLEESGSAAMDFWSIEEADNGGYTVYFSVKVPVYLNDSGLASQLQYTAVL